MKVRCINNLGFENRLEENKIYTVAKEINGRYILEELGDAYEFGSERFEEVEEKKGLNIIEAIKMPVGTEFEVIFNGEKIENNTMIIYRSLGDKECKHIDWKCHPQDTFMKPYDFLINGIFIPIQEPVSFMEAINAGLEGKMIKVDLTELNEKYSDDEIGTCVLNSYWNNCWSSIKCIFEMLAKTEKHTNKIINEGKWYIKED